MFSRFAVLVGVLCLLGCTAMPVPYVWPKVSNEQEAEYSPYMQRGDGIITGQAFLVRRDGMTIRASGEIVTLDPATALGAQWWGRPVQYQHEYFDIPPSGAFLRARRWVVADADGNFRFENLPPGRYYVQVSVTWDATQSMLGLRQIVVQGGMVGKEVQVPDGGVISVALGPLAWRVDLSKLKTKYRYMGPTKKSVPIRGHEQVVLPQEKPD